MILPEHSPTKLRKNKGLSQALSSYTLRESHPHTVICTATQQRFLSNGISRSPVEQPLSQLSNTSLGYWNLCPRETLIPKGHCQVNITTFAFPAQDFESQELLRQAFAYCNLFLLLALVFLTIQDFFMFISFPPLLSFWDARLSSISANTGERKANSSPPLRWRKISITPIPLLASGLFRPFSL